MAFVVIEACLRGKYTDCVEVCPEVCVPEYPVSAIRAEEEVPN